MAKQTGTLDERIVRRLRAAIPKMKRESLEDLSQALRGEKSASDATNQIRWMISEALGRRAPSRSARPWASYQASVS